ncbi:MAG: MBL fold metallo-hydrolase [Candidatus Eremiobacteraeota bacterium]|nr:MBL fold metallo-hydrolase [Candidatus Eremiobacteraeota bacterium]
MIELEHYGPVEAFHHGRSPLGFLKPVMSVRCYHIDGLLVDSGLSVFSSAIGRWAVERGARRAVITHHHEDHSGNSKTLQRRGLEVMASGRTNAWVAQGFSIRLYQRLVWAPAPATRLSPLPAKVETERYSFEPLPAPGHCDDQMVFFEAEQGWLFSGDAFLARRIKYFRADEDFAATLDSLRRLTRLDFADLFCAHRPVMGQGKQALLDKLQMLEDLEGKVRELHERGLDPRAITRQVLGPESWMFYLFSLGDLSKLNLVRSILFGPKLRADFPPIDATVEQARVVNHAQAGQSGPEPGR